MDWFLVSLGFVAGCAFMILVATIYLGYKEWRR